MLLRLFPATSVLLIQIMIPLYAGEEERGQAFKQRGLIMAVGADLEKILPPEAAAFKLIKKRNVEMPSNRS